MESGQTLQVERELQLVDGDMSGSEMGVPMEQLLQELPLEDSGMIHMGLLVERISNTVYQTLQSLADTLPALSSDARRAKIYSTAIELRKLLVKLLVIVRWSKDSTIIDKTKNVVALLVEQQWAHEDVFSGLTQVRKILPNARMCDADLVTAIDVLRTGSYIRLPSSIKDSAVQKDPLSQDARKRILEDLDLALHIRLTCSESIPIGLFLREIKDGKVHLEAPGLYDVYLTASGPAPDDRWWMLEFKFKDDIKEDKNSSSVLSAPYLDQVYELAESQLAAIDQGEASGRALQNLHAVLVRESLRRRLHILYYDTQEMKIYNWGANLSTSLDIANEALEVRYWVLQRGSGNSQNPKALLEGNLKLSLESYELSGRQRVLSELIEGEKEKSSSCAIKVTWTVDDRIRAALLPEDQECHLEGLNLEPFLLSVIARHARAFLTLTNTSIHEQPGLCLCISTLREVPVIQNGHGPRYFLDILITPTVRLMLYVAPITGLICIDSVNPSQDATDTLLSLSETQDADLRRLAEQVNVQPSTLASALCSIRQRFLTQDIQLQLSWLGYVPQSSISLRHGELEKLALQPSDPLLYVPLGVVRGFYLMVYSKAGSQLSMAMLSTRDESEGAKAWRTIDSVKWLDHVHLRSQTNTGLSSNQSTNNTFEHQTRSDGFDLSDLEFVLNYCIATVAYSAIEEQLRLKAIPFALIGATTKIPPPPTGTPDLLLPSLGIQGAKLLHPNSHLADPNVSLQVCDWWLSKQGTVKITIKLKNKTKIGAQKISIFDGTVLDLGTGILEFTCHNVSTCIENFQQEWDQVARMCQLLETCSSLASAKLTASLQSVAPKQVKLHYKMNEGSNSINYSCSVGFVSPSEAGCDRGRCTVQFGGASESGLQSNPHQLIAAALERDLDDASELCQDIWPRFFAVCCSLLTLFQVLEMTYPILELLKTYSDREFQDATCPEVIIKALDWYRLQFANSPALDIRLLPYNRFGISVLNEREQTQVSDDLRAIKNLHKIWTQGLEPPDQNANHVTEMSKLNLKQNNFNIVIGTCNEKDIQKISKLINCW